MKNGRGKPHINQIDLSWSSRIIRLCYRILGILDLFPVFAALVISLSLSLALSSIYSPLVTYLYPPNPGQLGSTWILDGAILSIPHFWPVVFIPFLRLLLSVPPRTWLTATIYCLPALFGLLRFQCLSLQPRRSKIYWNT